MSGNNTRVDLRNRYQQTFANDTMRALHGACGSQVEFTVEQGFPDRGPRAQIWAPDRLFLGPLGLKYMH